MFSVNFPDKKIDEHLEIVLRLKTFNHRSAWPWVGEVVRKKYVQGRRILKSNRNIHA